MKKLIFKSTTSKLLLIITTCGLIFVVKEPPQEAPKLKGRVVMWVNTLQDCIYNGINLGSGIAMVKIINAGLSTTGENSYSPTGTWLRTHAYGSQEGTSPCDEVKIPFDGTQGKIISAPSSCCFTVSQIKWKNYNAASGTIDDMILNLDCTFKKYDSTPISFTDNDHIVIGGEFNTVYYVRE